MTNLLDSLKSLKDKISEIEQTSILPQQVESHKLEIVDNKSIIEKNLLELKQIQNNRVQINVGGRTYTFSLQSLKNSISENIFQTGEKSIFYDGSPDMFTYVSDILRNLTLDKPKEFIYKIKLRINEDEIILKSMINEIFPKSDDEIWPRLKIEREVIVERIVNNNNNQNDLNVNPNNANYNYNYNRNAAYGY